MTKLLTGSKELTAWKPYQCLENFTALTLKKQPKNFQPGFGIA